ncbi:DUF58 domain-containing protein [Blastopirellula sp. JC732]|uniref:DUF58 domain-containing protein n=1 Tax=Blastopirellula sediminis TaxID=2894196 RepID=A0A9X1MK04_9BACT|nr:DUF58 domain-containing protein [Blastopirellula sediminis]MCC9609292.1 DUF58 domain-containing protein [Blastopirellula sediminis]MCC9627931.1 DUF58 domain-containing protein [Blastopirellula sediminis]
MNLIVQFLESTLKTSPATPIMMFVIFAAPLLFYARFWRIYPTRLMALLFAAPLLASVGVLFSPFVLLVALALDGLIILVGWLDLVTLPQRKHLSAERETLRIASLQKKHRVSLLIENRSPFRLSLAVRDDVPQEFTALPEEFQMELDPHSRATVHYEFEPSSRGAFTLEYVYIQVTSFFRLWRKYVRVPVETEIKVYPDMKQLSEYAILARTNRLSLMGVRRTRKVGQDHDFERLRDYTPDDNYKHIDWRTTARRRKLTVREFQSSQSQRIIFLIDCGRMMTNEADGISLLDHSLNAMLMMSYVALRQGDSVGAICFSNEVLSYVPPRSGANQMNHLLHASYDRFPQLVESRYDSAFMYLRTHCQKRSLVVMISNVIDEVNAHQIEQYLGTIVGRHLPLGILLRDHRLFDAADSEKLYGRNLFEAAAAAEILTWRHQVLTDLAHRGVMAMDVFPEDLTANLVNQYLEIKARHLL